jgi:hypothetical protein
MLNLYRRHLQKCPAGELQRIAAKLRKLSAKGTTNGCR